MPSCKTIALVAHDRRKTDLAEWVSYNTRILIAHRLVCTGPSGQLIEKPKYDQLERLGASPNSISIRLLKSGPLGGAQQLGAVIAEGEFNAVIFFWDPMQPQPNDVNIKPLLRIAVVDNVLIACNRATADFVISSSLMNRHYEAMIRDYRSYLDRGIENV